MNTQDLGQLEGDLLIFGGPYSNLQALQAFDRIAADYPASNVICTGDVVAYCADPAACMALIRARGWTVVAGNCERQLQSGADTCGCGFDEGSVCDRLSRDWFPYAKARIGQGDRAWMATLPDGLFFEHAGRRHIVLHGGASDVAAYLWPTSPTAAFEAELAAIGEPVDVVICGHSGLAFVRQVAGVTWVNAGVIGMPPHDGRAQTRYCVLSRDGPRIERLTYDADTAAVAMQAVGLTGGYDQSLITGIWPSESILPAELRRT